MDQRVAIDHLLERLDILAPVGDLKAKTHTVGPGIVASVLTYKWG